MDEQGNVDIVNNAGGKAVMRGGRRSLANLYPDPLGLENADKDPELTDDIVTAKTNAETPIEIAKVKAKYQQGCQVRRQMYQQIDLAIKDKQDDTDIDIMEDFLHCAKQTLSDLHELHSELSFFEQTKGQKQTFTRHFNLLKELIEHCTNLVMDKLKDELKQAKIRIEQNQNPLGDDQVDTEDDVDNLSEDDGSLNLGRGGERFAGFRPGALRRGAVERGRYQR